MKCDRYEAYGLGEMNEDDFSAHRGDCAACAAAYGLDERIAAEARGLPGPRAGGGLWDRIAAEIEGGGADAVPEQPGKIVRPTWWPLTRGRVWAVAAVLVLCLGLGAVATRNAAGPEILPRNILATEALARVEAAEEQYEAAIRDLEAQAESMLAEADTRLMLRYRQRLEVIDAQIRDCRDMLAQDTANAHVRRYLLAAYRDKSETLTELLELAKG